MKTSKIIAISLIGLIALFILAAFINIRVNGQRLNSNLTRLETSKKVIPSFKVLRVENCDYISFVQSDSSFIEVAWAKDSLAPQVNYALKNDTLLLSGNKYSMFGANSSVKVCFTGSLESIIMRNSTINVEGSGSGEMSFDISESVLNLVQDSGNTYSFKSIDIKAGDHSEVNSNHIRVGNLSLYMQHSNANLESITDYRLSGMVTDSSVVVINTPSEISLKRDSLSKIQIGSY
jgi:hypothetical protein